MDSTRGEQEARRFLTDNANRIKKAEQSDDARPYSVTVSSVSTNTVRVKPPGADPMDEDIPYISSSVAVGDRGVVFSARGGGKIFAKLGTASGITARDKISIKSNRTDLYFYRGVGIENSETTPDRAVIVLGYEGKDGNFGVKDFPARSDHVHKESEAPGLRDTTLGPFFIPDIAASGFQIAYPISQQMTNTFRRVDSGFVMPRGGFVYGAFMQISEPCTAGVIELGVNINGINYYYGNRACTITPTSANGGKGTSQIQVVDHRFNTGDVLLAWIDARGFAPINIDVSIYWMIRFDART